MFALDLTSLSLRAKLASATGTTEPVWHVWYKHVPLARKEGNEEYPLAVKRTPMTGTTEAVICNTPPSVEIRVHIVSAIVVNRSTDTEIFTVETWDGTTAYPVIIHSLAANEFLAYEHGRGWYDTQSLTGGGGGGTTVVEFNNDFILPGPGEVADQDSRGIKVPGVLGETVAFGEVMYLKASDSQWYKADASVVATSGSKVLGVCLIAGNDNGATQVL